MTGPIVFVRKTSLCKDDDHEAIKFPALENGEPVVNVDSSSPSDNNKNSLEVFTARCEAIALLWQAGEYGLDERALQRAVDYAFSAAPSTIDPDTMQAIMGRAFAAVRDDLNGWRP